VRIARLAATLACLAALAACSEPQSPEEVALEFWTAAVARDFHTAARYAGDGDVADSLGSFAPQRSPAIGEALTSEDRALVETVFLVGEESAPLSFRTHLQRAGATWRVDLAATREELLRALVALPAARAQESLDALERGANPAAAQEAAGELRRAADDLEDAVAVPEPGGP
jgi:hypothetical protein